MRAWVMRSVMSLNEIVGIKIPGFPSSGATTLMKDGGNQNRSGQRIVAIENGVWKPLYPADAIRPFNHTKPQWIRYDGCNRTIDFRSEIVSQPCFLILIPRGRPKKFIVGFGVEWEIHAPRLFSDRASRTRRKTSSPGIAFTKPDSISAARRRAISSCSAKISGSSWTLSISLSAKAIRSSSPRAMAVSKSRSAMAVMEES